MTASLAGVVLLSGGQAVGEEAVLYRETFPNAAGSGQPLSTYGWSYHLGTQGWDEAGNDAAQGLVNEGVGSGAGLLPVHAGGDTPDAEANHEARGRGFVVNALGPDGAGPDDDPYWNQLTHYATTELSIDRSTHRVEALGLDLALSQPDDVRLTVKIGDAWFASQQTFSTSPVDGYEIYSGFAAKAKTLRIDLSDAAWLPMNFVPGTTMGLDTSQPAEALPDGVLTGLGLLLQPSGFEAFDNVTVFGEPR
ncbi:MAG: hypothetical protein AAF328_05685 [Planctomycetota bacterium]